MWKARANNLSDRVEKRVLIDTFQRPHAPKDQALLKALTSDTSSAPPNDLKTSDPDAPVLQTSQQEVRQAAKEQN